MACGRALVWTWSGFGSRESAVGSAHAAATRNFRQHFPRVRYSPVFRAGDAFYFGGAPKLVEHGMFNESKDKPLTYVAIGVRIPGSGRGSGARQGAGPAQQPATKPGRSALQE
jgi:hypothetical protein